jgi:hypothetical protein
MLIQKHSFYFLPNQRIVISRKVLARTIINAIQKIIRRYVEEFRFDITKNTTNFYKN